MFKNVIFRRIALHLVDSLLILISFMAMLVYYRLGSDGSLFNINSIYIALLYIGVYFICVIAFKTYKTIWAYASAYDFLKLFLANVTASLVNLIIVYLLLFLNCPINEVLIMSITYFIASFSAFGLMVLLRIGRIFVYQKNHNLNGKDKTKDSEKAEKAKNFGKRTMIIGAGWTGNNIITELQGDKSEYYPVCVIDDDPAKGGMNIRNVPIVGNTKKIAEFVIKYQVEIILLAIPSASAQIRKKLLNKCVECGVEVRVIPSLRDFEENTSILKQAKEVKIEDLLGREPIKFDENDIKAYAENKNCLVTGGGGSIGSELCRQIASYNPKRLMIIDNYENTAYEIQQELKRKYPQLNLTVNIFSVADYDRLRLFFKENPIDIIVHAAAHKHVPLMEDVPEEAIKNNIVATKNLCEMCIEFNVKRFIQISTDKAVNPANVMGATKRCCEMIVNMYSQKSKGTIFCAVRFGNVLGSHGSVIPLFKEQIAEGGPVTVTDKRIIRYFMTISEAVSLVLKAGALAKNGELFVLDMGVPVKIYDLAKNLIRLSGFEPNVDIKIIETGLRPGEKLYEELLLDKEKDKTTSNEKIFVCNQPQIDIFEFKTKLDELLRLAFKNDVEQSLVQLKNIVPTFNHQENKSNKAEVV